MKPDSIVHKHKMALYNLDLIVDWRFENDKVKIVEVHIIHHNYPDLLNFLSGKVFKLIVEHIEIHDLKKSCKKNSHDPENT
jgi:hypothetical protein